jgi:hypothetical protein
MAEDILDLSGVPAIQTQPSLNLTGVPVLASQKEEEEEEVSVFGDIAQGVGAGAVGLVQGIAETGAALTDLAFDTDTSESVTQGFEAAKEYLGFTPETVAGQTAEAITTFGAALIPVIGWVGRASQVARGASVLPTKSILKAGADRFGKSKVGKTLLASDNAAIARTKLAATTSLTGGAVEMLVAPDGTSTLSDAFDVLPDALETEVDSGLQGRDEAARRLRNKLRMGVEGTALGAAFEAAFPVLGVTTKAISMVPGVPSAARAVSSGFDYLGQNLSGAFNGKVGKYFTASGAAPKDVFESLRTVENVTDGEADRAAQLFSAFDKESRKVVQGMNLFGRGKEGVQKSFDDLLAFLEGDQIALDSYAKRNKNSVKAAATKMRTQIDELSEMAAVELEQSVAAGVVNKDLAEAAISEIRHNKGSYLRRLFEGAYSSDTVNLAALQKKATYQRAVDDIADRMMKANNGKKGGKEPLTRDQAVEAANKHLEQLFVRGKIDEALTTPEALARQQKTMKDGANAVTEAPLYKLSEGMFKARSKYINKSPALRELLNEVKDPRELYLTTVSDLSNFVMTNKLYRELADSSKLSVEDAVESLRKGGRPLIISGENLGEGLQKDLMTRYGYTKVGKFSPVEGKGSGKTIFTGDYGALSGDLVAPEIKAALTAPTRGQGILNELLAVSLQAKGISQMGKTVLNPIAQVRNFAGGTFMVGANGNLPRTMELGPAMDAVYKKINALSDAESDQFYRMIQDLGLVDENLAINEMKLLLRETQGLKTQNAGTALNSMIEKVPLVKSMQKIYSDTDTYWKTVGFLGEKAKYSSAFRKAGLNPENLDDIAFDLGKSGLATRTSEMTGRYNFLDVFASDIVKETMPIYSRVPEVIKSIRRIPVAGNFVAFPAEVIRNTANIVQRGMRELGFKASDDLVKKITPENAKQLERQIHAIGMNRLTSYAAMAFVVPAAISRASYAASGVTEEQVDDMRPMLPEYMKGSQLISLSKPKNGKWEHADLSYMLPYDFAYAPARRAMQVYSEKGELGATEMSQITASMWEGFSSFMEPFASESLIAERIQDALPSEYFGRGGETTTGAPVWNDVNDTGTKLEKSFRHILGGFTPTMIEMIVRPTARKFEPGRITSAITGDPTGTGREYNTHEEAFSAITGVRKLELNSSKSLSYAGYGYTELRSQAVSNFNRAAKANDTTEADVLRAYESANEDAYRAQKKMYGVIKAAEAAGLTKGQIITALKRDSNLGTRELALILNGTFSPILISGKTMRDVFLESAVKGEARKISMLPVQDIMSKYSEYLGRSLTDETLSEPSLNLSGITALDTEPQQPVAAAAPPPPAVAQAGAAPAQMAAPAPTSRPQDAGGIMSFLSGGNPIDAIKNLQIFQRTQQ